MTADQFLNQAKYEAWHMIVKEVTNSILEHQRLKRELEKLKKNAANIDYDLCRGKNKLEKAKTIVKNIDGEVKDLRRLLDASKIWVEASMRIGVQRETVSQKEKDFLLMNSDREGRDLKQVEVDLLESNQKKDGFTGMCMCAYVCLVSCFVLKKSWYFKTKSKSL